MLKRGQSLCTMDGAEKFWWELFHC